MIDVPGDPRLPRLLSLAAHEFRTPLSVILGYLRMVLKDPSQSLDSKYRRMLEDTEKSASRVAALVTEMSDLSKLEKGEITLQHVPVNIGAVLNDAVTALPEEPERVVDIKIDTVAPPITIRGDATWLKRAFTSILFALRREVVESNQFLIRVQTGTFQGRSVVWIRLAEPRHIDATDSLGTFNEWRGGCGLSLIIAQRVISEHDGAIYAPTDRLIPDSHVDGDGWRTESLRAAAAIVLPVS